MLKGFWVCLLLLVSVCGVASQEWGDFSFMKAQKRQLFGWDYQGDYEYWFGARGYGFGLELGYIGVVLGTKESFALSLPEWLEEDESKRDKTIDVYLDGFTYVNLSNLGLMPERVRGWLFWELSFWFGVR